MKRFALIAALVLAALLAGVGYTVLRGPSVPAFYSAGLNDDDLPSGTILVNFFASWCTPCLAEHPLLVEMSDKIPVYGIASMDSESAARAFLKKHGNPYVKVGMDDDGMVAAQWSVRGLPTTFLVRDGHIVYRHEMPLTDDIVRDVILPLAGKD